MKATHRSSYTLMDDIKEIKKVLLEDYFEDMRKHFINFQNDPFVKNAFLETNRLRARYEKTHLNAPVEQVIYFDRKMRGHTSYFRLLPDKSSPFEWLQHKRRL